jgi:hypothetical protein
MPEKRTEKYAFFALSMFSKFGQLDILSTHFKAFNSQQPTRFHVLSLSPFANLQDMILITVICATKSTLGGTTPTHFFGTGTWIAI